MGMIYLLSKSLVKISIRRGYNGFGKHLESLAFLKQYYHKAMTEVTRT